MKLYELSKRDVLVRAVTEANEPFLFHNIEHGSALCYDKYGLLFNLPTSREVEVVDMYPLANWGEQYV